MSFLNTDCKEKNHAALLFDLSCKVLLINDLLCFFKLMFWTLQGFGPESTGGLPPAFKVATIAGADGNNTFLDSYPRPHLICSVFLQLRNNFQVVEYHKMIVNIVQSLTDVVYCRSVEKLSNFLKMSQNIKKWQKLPNDVKRKWNTIEQYRIFLNDINFCQKCRLSLDSATFQYERRS